MTKATIIVPAHNEEGVIGRTLAPLVHAEGLMSVIVVANGCNDATAEHARGVLPWATVVELREGGKANAINEGLTRAGDGPVIIMDADIEVDLESLHAVAAALDDPGVSAASPTARMDSEGADWWVASYYRVFAKHGYLRDGVGGSGIYALSQAGRRSLPNLPQVIADDGYVRAFFPLTAQRRITAKLDGRPLSVTVRTPHSWSELVRTEARWRAGDAQVRALLPERGAEGHVARDLLRIRVGLLDRMAYIIIKLLGRAQLLANRIRGKTHIWHRDVTSRGGGEVRP